MTKIIVMNESQWEQWQLSAEYRAGFADAAFLVVEVEVSEIELWAPGSEGPVATATKEISWAIS